MKIYLGEQFIEIDEAVFTDKNLERHTTGNRSHILEPGEEFNWRNPKFDSSMSKEDYAREAELLSKASAGKHSKNSDPEHPKNKIFGWVFNNPKYGQEKKFKVRIPDGPTKFNPNAFPELVIYSMDDSTVITYMLLKGPRALYDYSDQFVKELDEKLELPEDDMSESLNEAKGDTYVRVTIDGKGFFLEGDKIYKELFNSDDYQEQVDGDEINEILSKLEYELPYPEISDNRIIFAYKDSAFTDETREELQRLKDILSSYGHKLEITNIFPTEIKYEDDFQIGYLPEGFEKLELDETDENIIKKDVGDMEITNAIFNNSVDTTAAPISESIEKHEKLNPNLWGEDEELLPEVRGGIEKVVQQFIDELEENDVELKVLDIILVGSNASYNYTKDSDLDVHIVADTSIIPCEYGLLSIIYNMARSQFNNKYDVTIHNIPIEIYVEDMTTSANSNGIYSLKNGWVKKPEKKDIPEIDISDVYPEWEDRAKNLIKEVEDCIV